MKKIFFIAISALSVFTLTSQEYLSVEFGKISQLTPEQEKTMSAAFTAMDAVQKAGNYIKSLDELLTNGKIPLPVGVVSREGGYELIVHKIEKARNSSVNIIYATCAFTFKDGNQRIAFEGQVTMNGQNGFGSSGKLTLIAPVIRNLGNNSAIILRQGTSVAFGCNGIESFDAHLSWVVTSDNIIPVNRQGVQQAGQMLGVDFDAHFEDFDNYLVSVNIDRQFAVKGLDDMIFSIRGAVIDQSDTENAGTMRFPPSYFNSSDLATQKLWKGVAVREAAVSLPAFFKKQDSDERVTLALNNVLFDENGFSGNISVANIIPSSNINPESWDVSLSGFTLGILKNDIVAFGISGDLNIPPFGKNSLLPYSASYNSLLNKYEFRVNVSGNYDFPALRSTLTLYELSTIQLQFRDGQLYPVINATGKLSVNAPISEKDSAKVFSVPDISFENLVISRQAPYFQIGHIGVAGNLASPNIAGFEVSIGDISTFKSGDGEGLRFTGSVGLAGDNGLSISGQAGIKLYVDYNRWRFDRVAVDRIDVDYQSEPFSLRGGVWFKNGDKIYGDGFRGDLQISVVNQFNFDAVGVFGKKDDFRYFLADVFFETTCVNGIPISALSLYGFGGGVYRRMQQAGKSSESLSKTSNTADLSFGQSLSGINYVPDRNVGMGLMAAAKLGLKTSEYAFNAKVGFEMQFNSRGGLNFIQLRGDGAFMDFSDKWGGLADNINSYAAKNAGKDLPQKLSKSDLENRQPENKNSGLLTASLLLEYDNINKSFNGDLSAYLNAYGIIKGAGANDRLGWANAYFAPDSWHIYVGTPADRFGISVLNLAQVNGYFMLGDGIPALPPPPANVLQFLSEEKRLQLNKRNSQQLGEGKGIAFGAEFKTGFDASYLIFYAKMNVGLGSEFMLTNLNGATCAGFDGTPGFNGWYAQGQAWAYVDANIGLQAKLFGSQKRFPILDIGTGALLEAKGPNPFYFAGAVGGKYSVLGGLIKGNCNFEFEIGQECKPVGGSPFGEDVIAQLTPGAGDRDVNVFAAPQAIFNIPIEQEMTVDEDDGSKGTYKITLDEFSIKYKDNNRAVSKTQKTNQDGTVCMLSPDEPFESQKEMEIYAKVGFKRKNGNNWIAVKGDNGQPFFEEKRAAFHTGNRPKEIQREHVAYSYPLNRQYNFYSDEYSGGYLLLTQNYSYLFTTDKPTGFDQKLRISTADGQQTEKNFTYTANSTVSGVKMEISFSLDNTGLQNNKIYKLSLVNIPQNANVSMTSNISESAVQMEGAAAGAVEITRRQATGTIANLTEKEIYSLTFKTSSHKTFADKIRSFEKQQNGWRDPIYPYIHNINTNLLESELFDAYETGNPNVNVKTVNFTAQLGQTPWFTQTFYDGMYKSQNNLPIPADRISVYQHNAPAKLLSDDEITVNIPAGYGAAGVMRYELSNYCAQDFYTAKQRIGAKLLHGNITAAEAAVLNQDFPPVVFKGNYPVMASYVLPGKNTVTSTVNFNMYNPID